MNNFSNHGEDSPKERHGDSMSLSDSESQDVLNAPASIHQAGNSGDGSHEDDESQKDVLQNGIPQETNPQESHPSPSATHAQPNATHALPTRSRPLPTLLPRPPPLPPTGRQPLPHLLPPLPNGRHPLPVGILPWPRPTTRRYTVPEPTGLDACDTCRWGIGHIDMADYKAHHKGHGNTCHAPGCERRFQTRSNLHTHWRDLPEHKPLHEENCAPNGWHLLVQEPDQADTDTCDTCRAGIGHANLAAYHARHGDTDCGRDCRAPGCERRFKTRHNLETHWQALPEHRGLHNAHCRNPSEADICETCRSGTGHVDMADYKARHGNDDWGRACGANGCGRRFRFRSNLEAHWRPLPEHKTQHKARGGTDDRQDDGVDSTDEENDDEDHMDEDHDNEGDHGDKDRGDENSLDEDRMDEDHVDEEHADEEYVDENQSRTAAREEGNVDTLDENPDGASVRSMGGRKYANPDKSCRKCHGRGAPGHENHSDFQRAHLYAFNKSGGQCPSCQRFVLKGKLNLNIHECPVSTRAAPSMASLNGTLAGPSAGAPDGPPSGPATADPSSGSYYNS